MNKYRSISSKAYLIKANDLQNILCISNSLHIYFKKMYKHKFNLL